MRWFEKHRAHKALAEATKRAQDRTDRLQAQTEIAEFKREYETAAPLMAARDHEGLAALGWRRKTPVILRPEG